MNTPDDRDVLASRVYRRPPAIRWYCALHLSGDTDNHIRLSLGG